MGKREMSGLEHFTFILFHPLPSLPILEEGVAEVDTSYNALYLNLWIIHLHFAPGALESALVLESRKSPVPYYSAIYGDLL